MKKAITINKDDPRYANLISYADKVNDENLVIIARSERNRKDDRIVPLMVKNGIYFYVGNYVDEGVLVYPTNYTAQQVEKAKSNMNRDAMIGNMLSLFNTTFKEIDKYTPTEDELMTICRTKSGMNGAGLLICKDFLYKVKAKFGNRVWIIPSSVHEIIIVPANKLSRDDTLDIVRTINKDTVSDEDFLADAVYTFDDWDIN